MRFRTYPQIVLIALAGICLAICSTSTFAAGSVFDLAEGFSSTSNPNGPWAYGWKGSLGGAFTALTVPHVSTADGGQSIPSWQLTSFQTPAVYKNTTAGTVTSGSGAASFAPGTVWYFPGENGRPENLGVIRFTVPAGASGNYDVRVAVGPVYNGAPQGDTDFHVVKNGMELFGRNLPVGAGTGYTNIVALNEGETVDLAIGRGTDGNQFGSGLKIAATLTRTTNTPPPPPSADFDLAAGFSAASNPNGPWAYGWKGSLGGAFTALTVPHVSTADGGQSVPSWQLTSFQTPAVYKNTTAGTVTSGSGAASFAPGTVWYFPGENGRPENLGVIRFTVPAGASGNYDVRVAVGPVYNGAPQGDTDFHVVKNGMELFGRNLPVGAGTGYTNIVALNEGETVDLAIGRGTDGNQFGSGLKIAATLTRTTNTPPPVVPGLVVPNELANADAAFGSGNLFNPAYRSQQVYGSSEFGSVTGAVLITELRYRPDYFYGGAFSTTISNIQFNLSTTTRSPEGLSSTFANNVGADDTVVFSGPLSVSSSFSGPAGGPKAFDIVVPLTTPFVYNPAAGNLLVEIRNFSGSSASLLSGQGVSGDGASRMGGSVNSPNGVPDTGADALAIVYTATNALPPPPPPPVVPGLVVPNELANADAAFGSGNLFNPAYRSQQVYGSSEFGSVTGAVLITELRYRPDYFYGGAFSTTISNIQFNLSTTTRSPEGLSSTFANNVGADDTVVFSGPLSVSSSFSGPAGGPKAFDIVVPLTTPFVYNPAAGNLLVEIRNFSGSSASLLSGQGVSGDGASRVGGSVNSPNGVPDIGADALAIIYTATNVPPNQAPIASFSITPIFVLSSHQTNAFILSANNMDALVRLDGSRSFDPDGHTLEFHWFSDGILLSSGMGASISARFDLGVHEVTLRVSDGEQAAQKTEFFEVITFADALSALMSQLSESGLPRNRVRPLLSCLKTAMASFDRDNMDAGINQLEAFRHKVSAQIGPRDPELASKLGSPVQFIIDAAQEASSGDDHNSPLSGQTR